MLGRPRICVRRLAITRVGQFIARDPEDAPRQGN